MSLPVGRPNTDRLERRSLVKFPENMTHRAKQSLKDQIKINIQGVPISRIPKYKKNGLNRYFNKPMHIIKHPYILYLAEFYVEKFTKSLIIFKIKNKNSKA